MLTRLRHVGQALVMLPGVLWSRQRRALLREMRAFCRDLPQTLQMPLPAAMQTLTPPPKTVKTKETELRRLADLAALLERGSPLGLCLRRSLIRYHFLRDAGVPLQVHFGARFRQDGEKRDVAGHAWVTFEGRPYYEADENWRNFKIMYSYPEED